MFHNIHIYNYGICTYVLSREINKNKNSFHDYKYLRTEVRGGFNIHGTKFFYNAVFHQKSKNYDFVSLPVPLVGQKTRPPSEDIFSNKQPCQYFTWRTGFLAYQMYRKAYNIIFF